VALELLELRSFVVLANHLHFGQAAEALHVSQPAPHQAEWTTAEPKWLVRFWCAGIDE